ncbi:MAG TPA: D-alanine--D-alanine ligase [Acetobacteraceae bacterium]|nr:D-alanine--D-alanine ligase [Acetobacteraceae bacterium]
MSDAPLAQGLLARLRARRAVARPVSFFEFWPDWVFYAPVVLHWLGLAIRHRGLGVMTAANPHIETGGLCGESKVSILDQMGGPGRDWVAPYTVAATGAFPDADDLRVAEAAMAAAGLSYPLVVKPDVGCNGTGVRVVAGRAELARYLAAFPRARRVVLQALVPHDGEAGVFYIRRPGEKTGRITSVTLKSAPIVIGDGRATLRELVLADARAGLVPHLYLPRLAGRLHEVPAAGEVVRLVFVGNHLKGSIFRNGAHVVTPALTARMEAIARSMPDFHFGRFDLRYRSIAELRRGEGFRIIEVNGTGSEATHIWDPTTTLSEAYAAQFMHYRLAFEIGAVNRARGYRPARVRQVWRLWREQKRLMASYPLND